MDTSFVTAIGFGPTGAKQLNDKQLAKHIAAGDPLWVHIDVTHPEARLWADDMFGQIDPHTKDALFADTSRPRADKVIGGVLVVLRGVNLNPGAEPDDMVSLRLWVSDQIIVSTQLRQLKSVTLMQDALMSGNGPSTIPDLLAGLIDALGGRIESTVQKIDEAVDDMEEALIVEADPSFRRAITELRRQTIHFRRHIAPQRDAIHQLRSINLTWINETMRRRLSESLDNLTRVVEELDAIRERTQVMKDELASELSERLNRNLYTLSIISAVFLPLGFLTGLMGINLGGMPGAEFEPAFWLFSGFLLLVAIGVVIVLRRFRWL